MWFFFFGGYQRGCGKHYPNIEGRNFFSIFLLYFLWSPKLIFKILIRSKAIYTTLKLHICLPQLYYWLSILIEFFLDFPCSLQLMSRIILWIALRMPLSSSYSLTANNNVPVYFYGKHLKRSYFRFPFCMQISRVLVSLMSLPLWARIIMPLNRPYHTKFTAVCVITQVLVLWYN